MQTTHRAGRRKTWRAAVAGTAGAALIGITVLQAASAGESGSDDGDQRNQQEAAENSVEPAPQAEPEVGSTPDATEIQASEEYWTEERMAAAEQVAPPEVDAEELSVAEEPSDVLPRKTAPGTVPEDSGETVDGAGAPYVPIAERWHGQGEMPARTTGKIYYTRTDGVDNRCSASVITSENENMVWTAGHCVHDGESGPGGFYTNIMYVPDHDNGDEPHGRWSYNYVNTSQGWSRDGDLSYDYAGIALAPQEENGTVEGHLGAQGYDFGGERDFDDVLALSYPVIGYQRDDFTGEHLWSCQGPTTEDRNHVRMECDMRSGASGSPWLRDLDSDDGTGYLVSTHSYSLRDSDGGIFDEFTYGPAHADGAISLYEVVAEH